MEWKRNGKLLHYRKLLHDTRVGVGVILGDVV